MPSSPMFRTPARSEIVSPRAVNISGTPAVMPLEMRAINTACCNSSCMACLPAKDSSQALGQIARAEVAFSAKVLGECHEEQDEPDDDQQKIRGKARLLRGVLSTDGEHRVEGDKWNHAERVEASQKDERDDG